MYCFKHIQNSGIFRTLFVQVYSGIFKHIQHYYDIFRHIEVFLRHIQSYSRIFSTMCNPPIFTTLPCSKPRHLEPEAYSKPCETFPRYIKTPAIVRTIYPSIILSYSGIFRTLCKTCICRKVAYLELFHNCIPTHTQNNVIFTKIGKSRVILEIQNLGILTILEYS